MSDADLGVRLRTAREKIKLTQQAVIDKTSIVKVQTLSAYERGVNSPPLETLKELSVLYCVTTDYLLFGEDATVRNQKKTNRDHLIALIDAIDELQLPIHVEETDPEILAPPVIVASLLPRGVEYNCLTGWSADDFHSFMRSWEKLRGLYLSDVIDYKDYRYLMEKRISDIPDDLDFLGAVLPFF